MASLGMGEPFPLNEGEVSARVASAMIGNYALGYIGGDGGFFPQYAGRSDHDVKGRLLEWQKDGSYAAFKFSYAATVREAFEKECRNFHDFSNMDNEVHPARPQGMDWECQCCEVFD